MKKPLVSVGISFINRKHYLKEAIQSIYAQTLDDWELLLFDDGSNDGTLEWAKNIKNPKIRIFSDGKNRGYPFRLNQITDEARGKYIARMDDDDISAPDRLEKQILFLEKNPNVDVVGTNLVSFGPKYEIFGKRKLPNNHKEIVSTVYNGARIAHATCIGKKKWFYYNKYSPGVRFVADYDLWIRTFKESKFANINDILYYYREGKNFSFKSYSKAITARINRMHKSNIIKNDAKEINIAKIKEVFKLFICGTMCVVGMKKKFFDRRFNPLTLVEMIKVKNDLQEIKQQKLLSKDF